MFLHADSADSDQTRRMPRLIRVFAGRTLILLVLSCRGSNVVDDFVFIGVTFNYNGSFHKTKANLVGQSRKAIFSVRRKPKKLLSSN